MGSIAVGADADLVAFSPDASFAVHAEALEHKNAVSAYDGRTLYGLVETTWLAGEVVFVRGDGERRTPRGRLLERRSTS
jgi:allantoinase